MTQDVVDPLSDPLRALLYDGPHSPLEERDGILTPAWWTDSPQAFLKVFRENYAPNYRKHPYVGETWTPADRQMQVLETVLYLWYLARDENESE